MINLYIVEKEKKTLVLNQLADDESLYRVVAENLRDYEFRKYNWHRVDIWTLAKESLVELYSKKYPYLEAKDFFYEVALVIKEVIPDINEKQDAKKVFDKWFSGVLLAMYTITYAKESIEETNSVYSIADQIRDIIKTLCKNLYGLEQTIDFAIDDGEITDDYDYVHNCKKERRDTPSSPASTQQDEEFSVEYAKAEIDRLKSLLNEKEQKIAELTEEQVRIETENPCKFTIKENGRQVSMELTLREKIVIMTGIMRMAIKNKDGKVSANLRRMIDNGDTVSRYLKYMKTGESRPLTEKEKEHVRRFYKEENLDTSYILDYIN